MNTTATTAQVHTNVSALELAELMIAEPGQYRVERDNGALWITYPANARVADDGSVRLSNPAHSQEYAPSAIFSKVQRIA